MKLKHKFLIGLSSISLLSIPIATSIALISCSSSSQNNVRTVKFDTRVNTITRANNSNSINIFSANINPNAQQTLLSETSTLSVKNLQSDFNRVLTDFYESFETTTNGSEIEIDSIRVLSKNNNSFKLSITYEKEIDSLLKDSSESLVTKQIDWTPKFTLMSKADIQQTKERIQSFGTSETQSGMDLEDIRELFLGEKDADDFDDIGIFDRISLINKDYNNLAYLIAYELSISDIFDKLEPNLKVFLKLKQGFAQNIQVDKTTPFKIPSLSLNGTVALVPAQQPLFQFTNILSTADYNSIFGPSAKTTLDPSIEADALLLDKIFGQNPDKAAFYSTVKDVLINKDNSSITVNFKDASKPSSIISIARQWGL